jgi:hypothetical protein
LGVDKLEEVMFRSSAWELSVVMIEEKKHVFEGEDNIPSLLASNSTANASAATIAIAGAPIYSLAM